MDSVLSFISYLKHNARTLLVLVIINAVVAIAVISAVREPIYRAETTIVVNIVKSSFEENHALDFLLMDEEFTDFVHLLASDEIIEMAAVKFDLADHYQIADDKADRTKIASERLRRSIEFVTDLPTLVVYLRDHDPDVAEEVLLFLVSEVKGLQELRVGQNHQVTKDLALARLSRLDSVTNGQLKMLDSLNKRAVGSPVLTRYKNALEVDMANDVTERQSMEDYVRRIDELEDVAGYEQYYIINNGVKDQTIKLSLAAVLGLTAVLVALILELQLMFLVWYVKQSGRN